MEKEGIMGYINNLKLGQKIIAVNCAVIFIVLFLFITLLLVNIYNKSVHIAEDQVTNKAKVGSLTLEKELEQTKEQLVTLKDNIISAKVTNSASRERVISDLRRMLESNPDVLGFYTAWEPDKFDGNDKYNVNKSGSDKNGRFTPYFVRNNGAIGIQPAISYNEEKTQSYYSLPKETKQIQLIEPYFYEIDGKNVVMSSIIVPIIDNQGEFLGIVGADFKVDYLQKILEDIKPKGGYSILLSSKGVYVGHSIRPEAVGKSAYEDGKEWQAITEKVKLSKPFTAFSTSVKTGKKVLRAVQPVKIKGVSSFWTYIATVPMSVALSDYYYYVNLIIFGIIVTIGTLIGANTLFINKITSPLKDIVHALEDVSEGNLTVNIDESRFSNDEIGKLGQSINQTVKNLNNLIHQVNKSVEEMSAGTEEMSAAAEQTALGAQQVSISVAQLAEGANLVSINVAELSNGAQHSSINISQLAEGVNQISKGIENGAYNINNINKAIQTVSTEAVIIAKLGDETEINANTGRTHVKKAVTKIDSIKIVSTEISNTISELGKLSSEIETIVDLIKGISGQTNLLALNAAIEAARAGEHGKGFAVVADEVKKLATQSGEATDKITGMIKEIQAITQLAVSSMDKGINEVTEGVLVINDAGSAIENIMDQVREANRNIQSITKEIAVIAGGSEELVKMIEDISSITAETAASAEEISCITKKAATSTEEISCVTQETAASAQELAGISQEQTASIEEITASSQSLARVAEHLNKQVSVFKI